MNIKAVTETHKMETEMDGNFTEAYKGVLLANYTGMRSKEILELKSSDIDFDNNVTHQPLNLAFTQAVTSENIVSNPVSDTNQPSTNNGKISIWSRDEVHLFLEACRGERHYLTFLLAIYTGMRSKEILGLKWSDIEFNRKIIYVRQTKSSERHIPITECVLDELQKHKATQEEWRKLAGELYQNDDLVICTNTGSMYDSRNVVEIMKRMMIRAKVKEIRFQDMRHTHASMLISGGINLHTVSLLLGHANPGFTIDLYRDLLLKSHSGDAKGFHNTSRNHDDNDEDQQ